MGDSKAFLTVHRLEAGYRPLHDRVHDYSEVEQTLNSGDRRTQASRCHGLRRTVLQLGVPGGQPPARMAGPSIPRENRTGLPHTRTNMRFSGIHRTHMPGIVRKKLCAEPFMRRACDYPRKRSRHSRSRLPRRFVKPVTPQRNGRKVAVVGSRTGRSGMRKQIEPHGLLGHSLRKGRIARRSPAVRHTELQTGQGNSTPAHPPYGGRGHRVQNGSMYRQRYKIL